MHHADAGQKPGGKAEALTLQRLADFHHDGAELMTRNTSMFGDGPYSKDALRIYMTGLASTEEALYMIDISFKALAIYHVRPD